MSAHFENLWEECEKTHQSNDSILSIIDELVMKIELYKAIDLKSEIPAEEREKIKSRTMGEILLSITHLSAKDNINVFAALNVALRLRSL